MPLLERHDIGRLTVTRWFLTSTACMTLVMAGCASIPLPGGGALDVNPPELARKRVVGKQPPTDLIADDGSRCLATKARFERTIIGTEVWCLWRGDGNHP